MAEKGAYIAELPREGVVTLQALVKDKEIRPKRTGGTYLLLKLGDRTGEIDAKVWENPEEISSLFDREDVVKVRGTVERYNDRPQLIIQRIRRCEADEFEEEDFCPSSKQNPGAMWEQLQVHVAGVANPYLRALLDFVLGDPALAESLKAAPGAMSIHHCFREGLLEHVLSLCCLTEKVAEHYPRLDRDLLIAGAVLHDIGKTEELGTKGGFRYTNKGQLVGHVALGLEILNQYIAQVPEFPAELKSLIQHLVISHHGEIENGALREPMFPEAIALHYLDVLDARLEQAWRLIDQTTASEEWTAYVPSLRRPLYRGCITQQERVAETASAA
ncbi:MAG: 3'-5' exoribonuclease YhaM family protein [Candidatus Acidiferrales bacterium]